MFTKFSLSAPARKTTVLALAVTLSASLGIAAVTKPRPADAATTAVPSYAMGIAGAPFTIENPGGCNATLGAGGNLVEGGRTIEGRCQGAGLSPQITGSDPRALTFRTNKDYVVPGTLRDRTELATKWELPFHTDVWVGFDIRIPSATDDVTGSGAYVLQLWQCQANPIGGVRIQSGAGNGHNLQFVRRGEDPNTNYDISMATTNVGTNDEWHSFVIRYHVAPYHEGAAKGRITVFHKRVGATTVENRVVDREEYFGYATRVRCEDNSFKNEFKIKFGMYKDYQPGATFRSDFRNVRIGDSKEAVQPYNRG
ncbi:hypothetical protein ACFCV3_04605 [Kribbella sp. NPDC056345]|uniref:hypothetical protein n=1 Tax=Kribbella sp. NPDC056345 TaxID=3345789 RepID=UPI0035DB562F